MKRSTAARARSSPSRASAKTLATACSSSGCSGSSVVDSSVSGVTSRPSRCSAPISPAAPPYPRCSRPPISAPAPGLRPASTNTMSSHSVAVPFQCSATAAAFASFSTSTGHLKDRLSRSPRPSPVHPGSAVPRRTVPSASTMPGVAAPTARSEPRATPARRSSSATAVRSRSSRSSAGAFSSTSLAWAPITRPSRSDRSAATRCGPISRPSRWPASARNRNRRAGRPCRRAVPSSAAASTTRPASISPSTTPSTVGRDSPVTRVISVSVAESVARKACSTTAELILRNSDGSPPVRPVKVRPPSSCACCGRMVLGLPDPGEFRSPFPARAALLTRAPRTPTRTP
ncbi:hypothetical protein STENM36S_00040 [Streptomyces tendae]